MNAPGDPLEFYEDHPGYTKALAHYQAQGFDDLGQDVTETICNGRWGEPNRMLRHGELRHLWSRRTLKGQMLRGLLGMVETRDKQGRTAVFQFFCVAGNDKRTLCALTLGVFKPEEVRQFCTDHEGTPVKGGKP